MSYKPKVNDYVKWKPHIEGWVYFKCENYITIETLVRPKDEVNYSCSPIHVNNRLLVLCYHDQWKELNYVKSRKSKNEKQESMAMVGESIR